MARSQHSFRLSGPNQIPLKPHFSILEDRSNQYQAADLLKNTSAFQAIKNFKVQRMDDVFWLFVPFKVDTSTAAVVTFRHLTHAELYLQADTPNAPILSQKAGAFRPLNEIKNGDSRFHFSIDLEQHLPYKLLLKSKHTKKYQPVFDFELSNQGNFIEKKTNSELLDLWLQGASSLLIIYIFFSWLTTKYRPFIFLMLFALGFHLYDISLNRYFIDWLLPNAPQYGWLFVQHFLQLGLVGLFLLLIDSWKIRDKNMRLYRYGKMVIACIFVIAVISFLINFTSSNYKLSTQINICFSLIFLAYAIYTPIVLWHQLDKQERYLVYGLALYVTATIFFNITITLWGEQLYLITPIATKIISITVVLLFFTGLNARLRQNELDKLRYLDELNQLQKYQNELLEESVALRTSELSQRNQRIETLMNELNHRVKNNLQLLYSLNSLQLPSVAEASTTHLLKDNIARIKAMMLVNDSLNPSHNASEKTASLNEFIAEIAAHSKRMFVPESPTKITLNIDEKLVLDSKVGLSLGLIVSELITNSYKHAFATQPEPAIHISISLKNRQWEMQYRDNGSGIHLAKENSFGLTLIRDLTRQLKGSVETANNHGLTYLFNFPI
ncbi:histidine kinase dimerization/phosphoacceptor domain -containing protein [Pedobacter nanyangensis]|uniref:histidine kinase dimerization/phosphoacceptor domain -containing protein n=1 Tax=Pedobacter nanyangensis TaxID=1562389 RepID=UPI0013B3DD78|nr:histidine kinase dimerization/phosphoacceptor domain -containing protein [Pedobacter nanyangensis]